MFLKNPNNLTLGELPGYFDQLVDHITKNASGFLTRDDIQSLQASSADLKGGLSEAKKLIAELHGIVQKSRIINS
jgi:hypothetical protein